MLKDAQAQVAQRDAWLREVAAASVAGRLDGTIVAVLVADGAAATDVDQVMAALTDAGATVGLQASLSDEWWTPELVAFRGEIADQVGRHPWRVSMGWVPPRCCSTRSSRRSCPTRFPREPTYHQPSGGDGPG